MSNNFLWETGGIAVETYHYRSAKTERIRRTRNAAEKHKANRQCNCDRDLFLIQALEAGGDKFFQAVKFDILTDKKS